MNVASLRLKYSMITLERGSQDHPWMLVLLGGLIAVIYYDEKTPGAQSRGNPVKHKVLFRWRCQMPLITQQQVVRARVDCGLPGKLVSE